jgi:hypothetical protein
LNKYVKKLTNQRQALKLHFNLKQSVREIVFISIMRRRRRRRGGGGGAGAGAEAMINL